MRYVCVYTDTYHMSLRPAVFLRRDGRSVSPPPLVQKRLLSFSDAEAQRVQERIDAGGLVPVPPAGPVAPPMPYAPLPWPDGNRSLLPDGGYADARRAAPPTKLEKLTKELRKLEEDSEPPPLKEEEENPAAAEGGATCKVLFTPTTVIKTCPTSSVLEYELTQHAERVLGDARVADTAIDSKGATLTIERMTNGVAFQKVVGGRRPFWSGTDSPKVGELRNFTPQAKAKLRADVERLHDYGIAHNDIHAGNVAIRSINADGQVTDAIFIDYSEAVDLSRLGDVPTTTRKISRGWNTGADWKTPYVEHLMEKGLDTAEGLFEAAKIYDLRRLQFMGV